MLVALIVACEVGFWVLLAVGLALRYLARMPRAGAAVLLMEPLLELILLIVTAIDLKNGAPADWKHGLAAVYIGFTVGYGHYTIRWVDGHAAHRLGGGPPPVKPPRHGLARARHEGKLWVRTVVMAAVAAGLLQLAVWYVGDDGDTRSLHEWQLTAVRIVGLHGLIALSYLVWRKKDKEGPGRTAANGEAARPTEKTFG
ncbi:hypothetical protein [Streptomyces sp. NPDC048611]|uniref:hypothetical protein n=1 Tax=Streptomyces sp. NPDC048611 TaxID=3155635 RepID=UPI00342C44F5